MADDFRDVFNDTSEPLGSLDPGSTATGTIEEVFDGDIFAVTLVAGRTYTFSMRGASSGYTVADPSFYLRDAQGGAIGFSSGIGGGSTDDVLVFTARTSGTFYVNAFGGSGTGTYQLALDTGFVDDYRDSFDDAVEALGAVAPGGSATGTFEIAYDRDVFAVELVAGRTYTIDMQGASSGFTFADPAFYLRNAAGSAVGFSTDVAGASTDDRLVFTVETGGTYYVDAYGVGGGTGTYRVMVDLGFVDDYRDSYDDANEALGQLARGGVVTGTLEIAGDQDVFAVSLVAGQTYTFEMEGVSSGMTLSDPAFYLRDAQGSAVGFSTGIGGGSTDDRLIFTAEATGTYYVDAYAIGGGAGTYRLALDRGFADDYRDSYDDTTEALGAVAPGGSATGSIELAGDRDVFAVTLAAGRTYRIDVQGVSSGFTLSDPSFYLRDAEGSAVGFSTDIAGASTNDRLNFAVQTSGIYYIDVSAASGGPGTYRVLVNAGVATPDDYRDVFNDASEPLGQIAMNGSRTGRIGEAGDRDVFAVSLVAGRSYTFDMSYTTSDGPGLADSYLRLLNGAGTGLLANNNFNGPDARIVYTATATGTFYLEARSAVASATGNYIVSAREQFDDYRDVFNDTTEPLGQVTVNGQSFGSIEQAGDRDVFAVSLVAGQSYTFDLSDTTVGGAALADPYLRLLNGAGTALLANNNFNGTDARIVYTAAATGTYYLEARSFPAGGTGNYVISARANADDWRDTFNDASEPLGRVPVNGQSFGVIETAGDRDVFAVSLVAGRSYTFDLSDSTVGGAPLADPVLRLMNGAGTALWANNNYNGTDARIVYTATATGTYYLEARSFPAGGTGSYVISARERYDDWRDTFNDTSEALGRVTVNGQSFGSIEQAGDRDVFAVSLVAGRSYTFDLSDSTVGGAALADPFLRLLNGAGNALVSNNNFNGTDARIVYTAAATGTYYLEARSAIAAGIGNYVVSARENADDWRDVFNDASEPLGRVAVNGQSLGSIETAGDRDVFAVSLVAGQNYTFDLYDTTTGGAALADPFLRLLNGAGTALIANNNFNGADSRIVFTAAATGTYYLEARSAVGGGTGNYLVTVRAGFDDRADSITDPASPMGVLQTGTARMGAIETAGDSDMFRFELLAGHSYALTATGDDVAGWLADPRLRLFDADGTLIGFNDDANGGLDSQILFTAAEDGIYYAEVSGVKSGTGFYEVGLLEAA